MGKYNTFIDDRMINQFTNLNKVICLFIDIFNINQQYFNINQLI